MRNPTCALLPFFGVLFALGVVGMPEGVIAQEEEDGCTQCVKRAGEPPGCEPLRDGEGFKTCQVVKPHMNCFMSSEEPDCVAVLSLDGRAVPWVATAAAVGGETPRWRQLVAPAPGSQAVGRQACTGAIVARRYSPAIIADIRGGLRRVTI